MFPHTQTIRKYYFVLINKNYPFGLIKYRSDDFSPEIELNSENAILKIKQPDWIK